MDTSDLAIRYGGRAAGAFVAYRYLRRMIPGQLGTVVAVGLGWLAGGLVADKIATTMGERAIANAQAANTYGSE